MRIDDTHLTELRRHQPHRYGAEGFTGPEWAARVAGDYIFDPPLQTEPHDRATLTTYCLDPNVPPLHAYAAAMAWGRQGSGRFGRRNAQMAWEQRDRIAPLILGLRAGPPREEAYDLLRSAGIRGLGPSFFTKLLAFVSPRGDMAIMDQFVGKAINLLYGEEVVILQLSADGKEAAPSSRNRGTNYGHYCTCIEELKTVLKEQTTSSMEERLFSKPGTSVAPTWRDYVNRNWKAAPTGLRSRKKVTNEA